MTELTTAFPPSQLSWPSAYEDILAFVISAQNRRTTLVIIF